jgi:hypothetical protein
MKNYFFLGLWVVLASFSSPQPVFANEAHELKDSIQTMQQAADELRPTDPQLAEKLDRMVDKKKDQLAKKEGR